MAYRKVDSHVHLIDKTEKMASTYDLAHVEQSNLCQKHWALECLCIARIFLNPKKSLGPNLFNRQI